MTNEFLAIDFETASESRASACAMGLSLFQGGELVEQRGSYIDPGLDPGEWSTWNIAVHGIVPEDVADAPTFAQAWHDIEACYPGVPLVAHYAQFDMSVLRAEMDRSGIRPSRQLRYACSWQIARVAWPELVSVRLPYVSQHLGIDLEHHDAASDAQAAGRVFAAAVDRLGEGDIDAALQAANRRWGTIEPDLRYETGTIKAASTRSRSAASFTPNPDADPDAELFGAYVAFTGTSFLTRAELQRMVADRGGQPQNGVTKQTNLLVAGHQDVSALAPGQTKSGKYRRAEELRAKGADIQIISDLDLQRML